MNQFNGQKSHAKSLSSLMQFQKKLWENQLGIYVSSHEDIKNIKKIIQND